MCGNYFPKSDYAVLPSWYRVVQSELWCGYRSMLPRALKKGAVYKASESGVFKQLCEKFDFPSDFRFSWGCFEVKSGFPLYFPLFSSNIRNILTIFDENRATAPCIVYASRP